MSFLFVYLQNALTLISGEVLCRGESVKLDSDEQTVGVRCGGRRGGTANVSSSRINSDSCSRVSLKTIEKVVIFGGLAAALLPWLP